MPIRGIDAKTFIKVGGISASGGSWDEVDELANMGLDMERSEILSVKRANNGWKTRFPGLLDAGVEFDAEWEKGNANLTALQEAFNTGDYIGMAILDGPLVSGEGLVADMHIFNFNREEDAEGMLIVSFTAKPASSDTPPSYTTNGVS